MHLKVVFFAVGDGQLSESFNLFVEEVNFEQLLQVDQDIALFLGQSSHRGEFKKDRGFWWFSFSFTRYFQFDSSIYFAFPMVEAHIRRPR